jgi:hypothetical protein
MHAVRVASDALFDPTEVVIVAAVLDRTERCVVADAPWSSWNAQIRSLQTRFTRIRIHRRRPDGAGVSTTGVDAVAHRDPAVDLQARVFA